MAEAGRGFLEEIAVVVGWHKACTHDIFHFLPCGDWGFTSCFLAFKDLFPPYEHHISMDFSTIKTLQIHITYNSTLSILSHDMTLQ